MRISRKHSHPTSDRTICIIAQRFYIVKGFADLSDLYFSKTYVMFERNFTNCNITSAAYGTLITYLFLNSHIGDRPPREKQMRDIEYLIK